MATLTLKGIPAELLAQLKRRAAEHRRSLNSEVLFCLERSLMAPPVEPEAALRRIAALRERLNLQPLEDAELRAAREDGRA